MTALLIQSACFVAALILGDGRGHAVRWRPGRHRVGRLVVTSPARLCDGTPLYLWASGRPPLSVTDVRITTKTPHARYSHSSRADGGSNQALRASGSQVPALLGAAATSPHPPLHPSGGGAATPQAA